VRYLVHLAQGGRKTSTIRRARIAIGVTHGQLGLPDPDRDHRVRTLERGIGRLHGVREEDGTPLRVPELEHMISVLRHSARDDRDRALLLLDFAGAFRSSELVAFDVSDLELGASGAR
jgi:integrase